MSILDPAPSVAALVIAIAVVVWWRAVLRILIACLIALLILGLYQVVDGVQLRASMVPTVEKIGSPVAGVGR
jgi:hypothetical protein